MISNTLETVRDLFARRDSHDRDAIEPKKSQTIFSKDTTKYSTNIKRINELLEFEFVLESRL